MAAAGVSASIPDLIPPSWGRPLTEADYKGLAECWIAPEIADAAMLRRVDEVEGRLVIGQKGKRDCTGILFPYYWPGQLSPFNYRLRRDNPDWKAGSDGIVKPDRKYLGPPNGANRLYIPIGITLEQLPNPEIPIVIVEGEKKALALWRLANHERETPLFIPIGIAGVWNWRGKIGKTGGSKGERLDVEGPINDLNRVVWKGRTTFVVFDTNVHTNESVRWARTGLARELATRSATVKLVNLPVDCGVNGIDDLLAKWGPPRVLELFAAATSGANLRVVLPPQFQHKPDGIFRVTAQGVHFTQTQLTNFTASIVANTSVDDGVEIRRELEIKTELHGRKSAFTIPASEFASMNWVIDRLGGSAVVFPNQRENTRATIQLNSLTATESCIYTHTGWRTVDGGWIYLHAGGAIGATGAVQDMNMRLSGSLSRYQLCPARNPRALCNAIKASLRILNLGFPAISFPLLAATFRAVFGPADFGLHLYGETGTFKSAFAAVFQQHFGAQMDRLHLPGGWSSTANSLEATAFLATDAIFVIDDFAPQGSTMDIAKLHSTAERIFRAIGNQIGRGRLDATARLRESKPPRALVLSTGEEIPLGQSVRARILTLEVPKGSISGPDLALCQQDAADGLYSQCMTGFVQSLAGRYDEARATFDRKASHYRAEAFSNTLHARTPEIVCSLQAAFEIFLEFAVATGTIDAGEADCLMEQCWNALREAAVAQGKFQGEAEPTARFLSLLRALLSSGRAHLATRNGERPEDAPASCGWRADASSNFVPRGDCIGWVDGEDLYLEPAAAFAAAQTLARETSEPFPISEATLRRRLRDKNLLVTVDKTRSTLTVRKTICGSSKHVLHLLRSSVLLESPDDGRGQ